MPKLFQPFLNVERDVSPGYEHQAGEHQSLAGAWLYGVSPVLPSVSRYELVVIDIPAGRIEHLFGCERRTHYGNHRAVDAVTLWAAIAPRLILAPVLVHPKLPDAIHIAMIEEEGRIVR